MYITSVLDLDSFNPERLPKSVVMLIMFGRVPGVVLKLGNWTKMAKKSHLKFGFAPKMLKLQKRHMKSILTIKFQNVFTDFAKFSDKGFFT